MGKQGDIVTLQSQRIAIGLSSVIGVTVSDYLCGWQFKMTKGGTLEIGVTSGGGWGAGYAMDLGEICNITGAGTFYMVASGATCMGHLLQGFNT